LQRHRLTFRLFPVLALIGTGCGGLSTNPGDASVAPDVTKEASAIDGSPSSDVDADSSARDAAIPVDVAEAQDACFVVGSDATPHADRFPPSDGACVTTADCTVVPCPSCGCVTLVYGVNTASNVECFGPPCPPPGPGHGYGGCSKNGFWTQDCKIVAALADVDVACIQHECVALSTSP
jgi:hypothetical protein